MFGKGIYFADVATKAANYCLTNFNNDGLLLMCEVALGTMRKLYYASNVTDIPNGTEHSVMGWGMYHSSYPTMIDGIPAAARNVHAKYPRTSLFYNEFIVYRPEQVRIKYLFRVKFHRR